MRSGVQRCFALALAGVVLTILNSWAIMVFVGVGSAQSSLAFSSFPSGLRADYCSGSRLAVRWCFVVWSRSPPISGWVDPVTLCVEEVPAWSGLTTPPEIVLQGGTEILETTVVATGFPWSCLAVRVQQTFSGRTMPEPPPTLWDGIALPITMSGEGFPPRKGPVRLPLVPLGASFVANVAFWALIAWGVAAAAQGLRRLVRRRRGLCPACGHRQIGPGPCSECGAACPRGRLDVGPV